MKFSNRCFIFGLLLPKFFKTTSTVMAPANRPSSDKKSAVEDFENYPKIWHKKNQLNS